jgi:hypothetical protein
MIRNQSIKFIPYGSVPFRFKGSLSICGGFKGMANGSEYFKGMFDEMVEFKVRKCFRLGVASLRPSEHSGGGYRLEIE